jgi:hypothetical protein
MTKHQSNAAKSLAHSESNLPTTITRVFIADLQLDPRNPRVHSERQINQLAKGIKSFGFLWPVMIPGELLGRYLNRAPEHLEFDYAPQGKPSLRTKLPRTSVRFNVSHSHGVALLAFTVGRQVGVGVGSKSRRPGDRRALLFPSRGHGIIVLAAVVARRRIVSLQDAQGGIRQSKKRRIEHPS